jgi:hypothetical protein
VRSDRGGLVLILGLTTEALWVAIAITAFRIFKQRSPAMALWFLILAGVVLALAFFENAAVMSMVSVSEAYARANAIEREKLETVRIILASPRNWPHFLARMFDGVTIFVFRAMLFRPALIPRTLAGFGLIAAVLQVSGIGGYSLATMWYFRCSPRSVESAEFGSVAHGQRLSSARIRDSDIHWTAATLPGCRDPRPNAMLPTCFDEVQSDVETTRGSAQLWPMLLTALMRAGQPDDSEPLPKNTHPVRSVQRARSEGKPRSFASATKGLGHRNAAVPMTGSLRCAQIVALFVVFCQPPRTQADTSRLSPVDAYDYVIGTQSIGAAYQFTPEPRLMETARAIRDIGASVIKFQLGNTAKNPNVKTLADMAERDPATRAVLDMPFSDYILWAYSNDSKDDPFNPANLAGDYQQLHALAKDLLTRYRGSGKTFYLGNWEGDWHLLHTDPNYVPSQAEVQRMIDWVNTRQRAVDDAKREVPPQGVNVFYYLEVNRVEDAMAGKIRVTNAVLPRTPVDYVSYSSYDAIHGDIETDLPRALNYIESKLPLKPGVPGKRVFIGEYGFASVSYGPVQQDALSRRVMRAGLDWGCPFVLYWEMYNNEIKDGVQQGYWLIDNHGVRQPLYFTQQRFLEAGRRYVADFLAREGRVPTRDEFQHTAAQWLEK